MYVCRRSGLFRNPSFLSLQVIEAVLNGIFDIIIDFDSVMKPRISNVYIPLCIPFLFFM